MISLLRGQTYTISAWVATNNTAAGRVPVTLLVTGGGNQASAAANPTASWQTLMATFTAQGTNNATVYLVVPNIPGGISGGVVYWDDVQVAPVSAITSMNYVYDGFGNLTSKGATNGQFTTSMVVEGLTNRIVSAGGVAVNYSASGNALNPAATPNSNATSLHLRSAKPARGDQQQRRSGCGLWLLAGE